MRVIGSKIIQYIPILITLNFTASEKNDLAYFCVFETLIALLFSAKIKSNYFFYDDFTELMSAIVQPSSKAFQNAWTLSQMQDIWLPIFRGPILIN